MPIAIASLNVESLRLLARDLRLDADGLDKDTLVSRLLEAFAEHGFDPADISTASGYANTVKPHITQVSSTFQLPPPPPFDARDEDRARRFSMWMDEFEAYLDATGQSDGPRTKALFLYCVGPDLKRFIDDKRKDASYKDIIKAISERFCSSSTTPFNRFKLSELRQHNGESVDDYVNRLRSQARFCNYKCTGCGASQEDHVLFDVILRNTAQSQLRSRVFERGLATLEELLLAARNLEIASRQSEQMNVRNSSKSVIDAVTSSASGTDRSLTKFRKTRSKNMGPISQLTSKVRKDIRCKFCDQRHIPERSKCPANGKKCTKCDQLHHFAGCCNSSRKEESDRTSTHTVSSVTSKDCAYHVNGGKQAFTSLRIHGVQHKFLIDSGATENIIPGEIAGADCKMEPCPSVRCYSGAKIQPLGRTKLEVALSNGQELLLSFMVVKKGIPLLCLRDCVRLGFLTLGEQVHHVTSLSHDSPEISRLLQKYSSLFHSDLGCVKGVKAHIQIKDGVSPRFFRNRSVPLALRDRVDAEIDSMIKRGTLHEVKPSKWASPVVIVPKPDGQLRLCADYTATLAKVVDTEAYPLPRPEELLSELSGNSVFSKLDLRTCFEQFELDEESKPLLTVNTSRGLLQYNRLPYGISSAPAIVQRAMEDLLRGINVQVYLDDILVASSSISQHLETLAELFKRLQSANLRLRLDKCEFAKPKVKYLGVIISGEGTSPDPEKVRAIDRFPVPSSIHELRSFLGLVRFYEKFVHSLSDIAKPLYLLLKKDAPWIWEAEQHNAFLGIKAALISPPCLHHFNASMSIVLATDASPVGVSAVLSHRDQEGHEFPVAFASRSLSACEMRYAQIDREALAIVYGVKKFRNYLLGRRFTLVTDHQPLQSIFGCKKGLPSLTTARLHRYSLFLLSYDFTVEYRPGIKNSNADALSRAPVDSPCDDPDETEEFLGACLASVKFDASTVASETVKDHMLSKVLQCVRNGWPSKPVIGLQSFLKRRNELSIHSDVLFRGHRVVVPPCLQTSVLDELHSSHLGIVKMKASARQRVWWPTFSDDVESYVKECTMCQLHSALPPSQPVQPWPAAEVWQRVHLDYATFKGKQILVLLDAGSKWIEAWVMSSTTSYTTLRTLYDWFTRFGFPQHVHADGGPQFTSFEFRSKLREWGVQLTISPPYSPISNGAAERAVRFLKDGLVKSVPLDQLLFSYRATPTESGVSPAEFMLGRRIRTRLSALLPSEKPSSTTAMHKFSVGDLLWIRDFRPNESKWQSAKCTEICGRSVLKAQTSDGGIHTRHVNQVRQRCA
ncbi:Uncharacterised protein r2_g2776 [Pycnogonum litorale]